MRKKTKAKAKASTQDRRDRAMVTIHSDEVKLATKMARRIRSIAGVESNRAEAIRVSLRLAANIGSRTALKAAVAEARKAVTPKLFRKKRAA